MILIDQGLLLQERDTLRTNRTMLLAHRVWLLDRDALPAAYGHALRLVACEYPEEFEDPEWNRCRIFEPLAAAITSPTAESWMVESNTTRWLKSMLLQKRSRFFRDSGTNKWEADELQAAEVTELRLIHGMRDGAKG